MTAASLFFGILAIIFALIPFLNFVAPLFGVIGIGLALIAKNRLRKRGLPTDGATGGLVTSIIGTALGLVFYVACVACISGSGLMYNNMLREMQEQGFDIQKQQEKMQQLMEKAIEEGKKRQELQDKEQNNTPEKKDEPQKPARQKLKPNHI